MGAAASEISQASGTAGARRGSGPTSLGRRTDVSIKEGGAQIEYEDQDPRIHQIWLDEIANVRMAKKQRMRWSPRVSR